MTVADLVVTQLLEAGVKALFGVPGGGGNLDLIAAAGRAGLPFVLTSTETAGAIAAIAQAEVTGRPGACLTTLGPGAASVINGVACAFLERAPIVVFTDSQSVVFDHQRIDHAALMAPITKCSGRLKSDGVLQVLMPAIHTAASPRPGPVHVDCPGDVMASTTTFDDFVFSSEGPGPQHPGRLEKHLTERITARHSAPSEGNDDRTALSSPRRRKPQAHNRRPTRRRL